MAPHTGGLARTARGRSTHLCFGECAMAYEKLSQPLAPSMVYLRRVATNLGFTAALECLSLVMGMSGYHAFGPMGWTDAFANAAMIMSGMGPLTDLTTDAGKLFEGAYALYS